MTLKSWIPPPPRGGGVQPQPGCSQGGWMFAGFWLFFGNLLKGLYASMHMASLFSIPYEKNIFITYKRIIFHLKCVFNCTPLFSIAKWWFHPPPSRPREGRVWLFPIFPNIWSMTSKLPKKLTGPNKRWQAIPPSSPALLVSNDLATPYNRPPPPGTRMCVYARPPRRSAPTVMKSSSSWSITVTQRLGAGWGSGSSF